MISSADAANVNNPVSFMITDTKFYVPIVTLSTKDNNNLTKQLNEGFKRTIYWNQGANRLFVFAFEDTRAIMTNQLMTQLESVMKLEKLQS